MSGHHAPGRAAPGLLPRRALLALTAATACTPSAPAASAFAQRAAVQDAGPVPPRPAQDNPATPVPAGFRHAFADADGVRLHHVVGGSGPPVVLLHGFAQTWYAWRRVMPRLAEAGYTVVAPDLRGLGASARPAGGYDKATLARDIRALVRGLGWREVALVGHDLGGPVAYAYAAAHPGEVRRLVVIDCGLAGVEPPPGVRPPTLWHNAFHQESDFAAALVQGRERLYLEHFYASFVGSAPNPIEAEDVDEYLRWYAQPGAMRAGFEYYRTLPEDARAFRELAKTKLAMPVLALGGAAWGEVTAALFRQVAADVTGGAVEGASHWIPEERPEELARRLVDFIGPVRTPAAPRP